VKKNGALLVTNTISVSNSIRFYPNLSVIVLLQ